MVKINGKQLAKLHVLISKLGFADDKEYKRNLVKQYTNGREESTKDLWGLEAFQLISDLEKQVRQLPEEQSKDRMRKLMIYYARQMGWERDGRADMDRIERWCLHNGMFKKGLMDHEHAELTKLVSQFEIVYQSHLTRI